MPRPKRTKVALTNTRVAKPAPPKSQPKVTTTSRKALETLSTFSDDSDGLVVKATSSRSRRKMPCQKTLEPVDEADLIMTGALPSAIASASPANVRSAKTSAKATVTPRSTRSSRAKPSPTSASAPPVTVVTEEDVESSGFGDLTFSSLGSESPAHGTRPPSAIKVGATPAHEASILAITNFKRRPRQPSLLRMVQQTTDIEDNNGSDLDDTENLELDDFLPEAESTPLNLRTSVADDETRNDSGAQVSSSSSRGVKRKLSPVVQVPRSSPPYDPPSGVDVESIRSSSPSLPDVLPSHEEMVEQTPQDDEPLSQTYAPPMSSTPVREATPPARIPEQRRTRGRGRSARDKPLDDDDDDESEGEETETPAKAKRTAKAKSKQVMSTVQLKRLLPRRRNYKLRDYDEFDLESSEVTTFDSDQDELQLPAPRTRQRPAAGKLASPKAAKKTVRGRKAPVNPSKTYSRRISSDKENEASSADPEEPTEASVMEHSDRLAAIRKKFAEVDKYELEFEDVDVTTSSSPFR